MLALVEKNLQFGIMLFISSSYSSSCHLVQGINGYPARSIELREVMSTSLAKQSPCSLNLTNLTLS